MAARAMESARPWYEPNENLAITPRVIYQDIDMDGYNRTDVWNMLGNEFTTTEPRVALGDRQQYTQLQEKFTDEFLLADLTIEAGLGNYTLTSISSYTDRDILVIRDATQLTGSVTYFNLGGNGAQIRLDSPLYDATKVKVFTQELRIASDYDGGVQWVAGRVLQRHPASITASSCRHLAMTTWWNLLLCPGVSGTVRLAQYRSRRAGRRHAVLLEHSLRLQAIRVLRRSQFQPGRTGRAGPRRALLRLFRGPCIDIRWPVLRSERRSGIQTESGTASCRARCSHTTSTRMSS